MLVVAVERFAHPAKVATLLARLGGWKLPPKERALVAIAAAFVLLGDVATFDQVVAETRAKGGHFDRGSRANL